MIHYTIEGQGQPLLMLHGFPNDSNAWQTITPGLVKEFTLILPDLPGAGKSVLPQEPLSLTYIANALKEILDRENFNKVLVIGHSMGGYTAMELAYRFPQYIAGVTLVHSLASADSEEKKENRRKAIALMRKGEAEKKMFLKGMVQNLFSKEYAIRHPESLQQVVANGMKLSTEALTALYTAIMERTDKREFLKQAGFPVQWIIGDEDNATSMKEALEQCSLADINDVVVYSPCGHMSFMEMPGRLVGDLIRFALFCYSR